MSNQSAWNTAPQTVEVPTIPIGQILPWLLFAGLIAMAIVFFVSADQGAISIPKGMMVHEFVHDGRHLLGYPCH